MSYVSDWLIYMVITFSIFALTLSSFEKDADAQMQRDEASAENVDKINPVTPVKDITKKVLDETVHRILPFEIPTDSKMVKDEKSCYNSCQFERDRGLKKSKSDFDRGHAWAEYRTCKAECPKKAAQNNMQNQVGAFENESDRNPAGAAIPSR